MRSILDYAAARNCYSATLALGCIFGKEENVDDALLKEGCLEWPYARLLFFSALDCLGKPYSTKHRIATYEMAEMMPKS